MRTWRRSRRVSRLNDEVRFPADAETYLTAAAAAADQASTRAVLVGGVVRDWLLSRPLVDLDFMVDPPAEPFVTAFAARLKGRVVSHPRFLTYAIHQPEGRKIDVATARTERYPEPGRLPVVAPARIEDDLSRRDFTINAIALWLHGASVGSFLDPFDGRRDLERRRIAVLHDDSFRDDPTRVFRAARFAGRFGFELSPETKRLMTEAVAEKRPASLTPARRRHELQLILSEQDPGPALFLLARWRALEQIHPALTTASFPPAGDAAEPAERLVRLLPADRRVVADVLTDLQFERVDKRRVLERL